jgi:cytochrome c-type biogenesis protein CcmE
MAVLCTDRSRGWPEYPLGAALVAWRQGHGATAHRRRQGGLMTPRRRRLLWVLGIVAGVGIAGALALRAFQQNVMFYFDPSRIAAGEVKPGQRFRLGGMVEQGSVSRTPGSLEVRFVVTDFKHQVAVRYDNVLPDLFREGAGVVAHGRLDASGTFVADEVLAKHDEKYMPPEVARSLQAGKSAAAAPSGEAR